MSPFYRTTITFEVLSEGPIPSHWDLARIHEETISGEWSGKSEVTSVKELTEEELIRECHEHGTDPHFFLIDKP